METLKSPIVNFDDIKIDEAAAKITSMSTSSGLDVVITPNVDHLSRLIGNRNPALHNIYKEASLTLCDSKIVEKLLRFKGKIIKNVIHKIIYICVTSLKGNFWHYRLLIVRVNTCEVF